MTAAGVIKLRHSHDRRTGKPYTYVVLETGSAYCISNSDADDSNRNPTKSIVLTKSQAQDSETADAEARRYLNKPVMVEGKLHSTNGGGPILFYVDITPR